MTLAAWSSRVNGVGRYCVRLSDPNSLVKVGAAERLPGKPVVGWKRWCMYVCALNRTDCLANGEDQRSSSLFLCSLQSWSSFKQSDSVRRR